MRYNKQMVLIQLKKNIIKLGHVPTKKEYINNKYKPSYYWFIENYKSFSNVISLLKLDNSFIEPIKKLTKEDLILKLEKYYKQFNKAPTAKDMKNPTANVYYNRFNTLSWTKILKEANLSANLEFYSLSYGKEKMIYLYNKLKRVPTRNEIKQNDMPSQDWYYKHFGSVEKACFKFGLIKEILSKEERIQISIKELKKLAKILNRVPKVKEFEKLKHKGYVRRDLEKNLQMSYNDICKKYLFGYILNQNSNINKKDICESIHRMYNEFGCILSYKDYKKLNYSYDFNQINRYCNMTYFELVEYLNYQPFGYCNKPKSNEQLLDEFYNLFKKLKRIPYYKDFLPKNNISEAQTYINRFQSIENVCQLLNIDWNLYYKQKRIGVMVLDKNKEICRSYAEKDITNFFIENNIKYIKEPLYSDLLKNSDKHKFDWKIIYNNKIYYIEYFGLYNNKSKNKIYYKYFQKTRKKIKNICKKNKQSFCIFIFPEDYRRHKIQYIFEQKLNVILKDVKYTTIQTKIVSSLYGDFTDEQLFVKIMKYSNGNICLPATSSLVKCNRPLYNEIIRRYKKYENFAKKNNVLTRKQYIILNSKSNNSKEEYVI